MHGAGILFNTGKPEAFFASEYVSPVIGGGACQEATSAAIYMAMLYELQILFLFVLYCI